MAEPDLLPALVGHVQGIELGRLPRDVVAMARLCLLDWIGVTIAGSSESLVDILVADALADGGGDSPLLGRDERVRPLDAVMINGAAGHALDYDDGNPAVLGHPTVALAPSVITLGAQRGVSGAQALAAFVAGFEASAFVGRHLGDRHYRQGFHGTATVGAFGAAVAAGRLLGLDDHQMSNAIGLAATRAAGLRLSFGTMAKPLHAGHAAWVGLSSARLAKRGFTGTAQALAPGGIAVALSGAGAAPAIGGDFAIIDTRFKWHASCYMTHGTIEALAHLRDSFGLRPEMIEHVTLRVPTHCQGVCDIAVPHDGLQIKFSLPMTAALALSGVDTSDPATFSDAIARDPRLARLRERVKVVLDPDVPSGARVRVVLNDGRGLEASADPSTETVPAATVEASLSRKFAALVAPRLGAERGATIRTQVARFEELPDIRQLTDLLTARPIKQSNAAVEQGFTEIAHV